MNSIFTQVQGKGKHAGDNLHNILEKSRDIIITGSQNKPSPGATFNISHNQDFESSNEFIDLKKSYVDVLFPIVKTSNAALGAADTDDILLNGCAGISWAKDYQIQLNGEIVESNQTSAEQIWRAKAMMCPQEWLDTYGKLFGCFLNKTLDTDYTGTNSAYCRSIIGATPGGTEQFNFKVPLFMLCDAFDWTDGENMVIPYRSIQFSGTRNSDATSVTAGNLFTIVKGCTNLYTNVVTAGTEAFTLALHLRLVKPRGDSKEKAEWLHGEKDIEITYPRYSVRSVALSSATSIDVTYDVNDPVALFMGLNHTFSTGNDIASTDWRINKITAASVEVDNEELPFNNLYTTTTFDTVTKMNWAQPYQQYLEYFDFASRRAVAPPVSYLEFRYAPALIFKLDKRADKNAFITNNTRKVHLTATLSSITGTAYIVIVKLAKLKIDMKTGLITPIYNVTSN